MQNIIPYHVFLKHAEKVLKTCDKLNIKGVYHKEPGKVVVTDGYRLYTANVGGHGKNGIFDIKGNELTDTNFPEEIEQVIPEAENCNVRIDLDVIKALDGFKALQTCSAYFKDGDDKKIKKKNREIVFNTLENRIETEYTSFIDARMEVDIDTDLDSDERYYVFVNSEFLIEAFTFLKDCGIETVSIYLNGSTNPILIQNELYDFKIIILPIRKGGV